MSETFWNHTRRDGECLIFTRCHDTVGYGRLGFEGREILAHRFAWFLYYLEWPNGVLDHLCRRPACVNPFHLDDVTYRENTLRGIGPAAVNAKKTHCIRGHAFAGTNLLITRGQYGPKRVCRACRRINYHQRKAQQTKGEG